MQSLKNYFRPLTMTTESRTGSTSNTSHISDFIDLTNDSFEERPQSTPIVSKPLSILATKESMTNTATTTMAKSTKTLGVKLGSSASYLPLKTNSGTLLTKKPCEEKCIGLMQPATSSMAANKYHNTASVVPLGKPAGILTKNGSSPKTQEETTRLAQEILSVREQMRQINKALSGNLSSLPDNGLKLQLKLSNMKIELNRLHRQYKMASEQAQKTALSLPTYHASTSAPKFESLPVSNPQPYRKPGVMMVAESLTGDALVHLHSSLRSSPIENGSSDPGPSSLTVPLMPHQKQAMAWLLWREEQHPKGGILADDMGLGKTLTMIALILRSKELKKDNQENLNDSVDKKLPRAGTLVVCPMSVLKQWEAEIEQRCQRRTLRTLVYHGKERNVTVGTLTRRDVVITTYTIVGREGQGTKVHAALEGLEPSKSQGLLFSVNWERVILDEAHIVRNPKTLSAKGVCQLRSTNRWCLTGTPIHNKQLDLYSLLCFLKFTPFNNEQVWRRCAENKSAMGLERLNTIMKAIMLRRTKEDLQNEGQLQCLPSKEIKTISVSLEPEEDKVYQHLLKQSKTLMAKFIMQRAEKQVETGEDPFAIERATRMLQEQGIVNMKRTHSANEERVQASHILLQLLRLRQICCHAHLAKSKIDEEIMTNDGIEDGDILDITSHMERMNIENRGVLDSSNPVFDRERKSSKISAVIQLVIDIRKNGEKAILVSQWTSMLDIVKHHLREAGIRSTLFTGKLNPKERQDILQSFNHDRSGPTVLLLSLTAGGTGVNLIGGNNMLLMDIHWNPQLEAQAMDRIYRVGQKRDVKIYRFICNHTVEQSIQLIQEKKLQIAAGILNSKCKTKIDFEDLKSLFLSI